MQIVTSSPAAAWVPRDAALTDAAPDLAPGPVITPDFKGFGCCFNEIGWRALTHLDAAARHQVLTELFSIPDGMGFNYCRLPIGANDYAASWYSLNEVEGDFQMANFSIARDEKAILPYLRAARAIRGQDFTLFASPWSPPTWMKEPQAYNFGKLIWEPHYRSAYADYFVRFVRAYAEAGFPIQAVHVQNEPDSDQKFPSCKWTGAKLRDFIRDDLGPAFARAGLNTEIWLGTIERGSFNDWVAPTLADDRARDYLAGVGFQWAGKHGVQRLKQAAPDLPMIQTENECGDGKNTWDYAHYVFDLIQHYLSNGAEAYVYWNAVLEAGGVSTWGWEQNSMISVDPATGAVIKNPEFHLIRHFAGFVKPGARVCSVQGRWAANALHFINPDDSRVWVLQNPLPTPVTLHLAGPQGQVSAITIPARGFASTTTALEPARGRA
jgi:glucosylceramidase